MKVNTLEQYYVKQYLEKHFYIEELKLTLIDRNGILVEDCNGDKMLFEYDLYTKVVKFKDVE